MQPNRPSRKAMLSPGQPPGNAAGDILETRFSSNKGKAPPSPRYAARLANAVARPVPFRLLAVLEELNIDQIAEIGLFIRLPPFDTALEVLAIINSMNGNDRAQCVAYIDWLLREPVARDDAADELAAQAQDSGAG